MRRFAWLVVLAAGCGRIVTHPTVEARLIPPEHAAVQIPSYDLHEAFSVNEALARSKYADEWILVSGIPGRVVGTEDGYTFGLVAAGETVVLCQFAADQQKELAQLPPAVGRSGFNSVGVIGRLYEIRRGPGYFRGTLVVLDCCQVRPSPWKKN